MARRFEKLVRGLFVGKQPDLADQALAARAAQLPPEPEEQFLRELAQHARPNERQVLIGRLASDGTEVRLPISKLAGVHRWSTGATNSGKSAQVMAEELQLIGQAMQWSLLHLDAKSESARWLTDLFLPGLLASTNATPQQVQQFLGRVSIINPFDENNLPPLNILSPVAGVSRGHQAKEVANLLSDSLGNVNDSWGPRMSTVISYAIRAALEVGDLSLLEVRSLLVNDQYLTGLLRYIHDPDVKEYFVYRFPSENREAVAAVVSRLDLLLLDDTARVLCAPKCLDFANLLEKDITVLNVGAPPRGATFLSRWWLSIFVQGLARAILSRPDGRRPAFCVLDEWWLGLDDDLASHFERLLSLARYKNVGLWLINQLPGQVAARSPVLLATIKNNCGLQVAFRQSFEDARSMGYMLPVSATARVKRDPLGPDWDTRPAGAEEQRKELIEELARLQNRTFWLYPKMLGMQAVRLVSPTVEFDIAKRHAQRAPNWLQAACRGHGQGYTRQSLDKVIADRRAQMASVAVGPAPTRPTRAKNPPAASPHPPPPSPIAPPPKAPPPGGKAKPKKPKGGDPFLG